MNYIGTAIFLIVGVALIGLLFIIPQKKTFNIPTTL